MTDDVFPGADGGWWYRTTDPGTGGEVIIGPFFTNHQAANHKTEREEVITQFLAAD